MSFGNPTTLSSVSPFSSYPQSFPASESFLMSAHPIRWPKYWVSDSTSVLPMNYQDWFPLGVTGLISLLSKGLSRVFSSTTVRKHQFFGPQSSLWSNSHIHIWIWGEQNSVHSTIYRESSLGKGGIKDAVKIAPVTGMKLNYFIHQILIGCLSHSIGEGNGNPLQYSCLENPMDRETWWATVCGVTKSWIRLSDGHYHIRGTQGAYSLEEERDLEIITSRKIR